MHQPCPQIGQAAGDHLLVRIDLVAEAGCLRFRHGERLDVAHKCHGHGSRQQVVDVFEGHPGELPAGQAAGDVADHGEAVVGQAEQGGEERGEDDGHEGGGDLLQVALDDEEQHEAAGADDERQPAPRARLAEEAHRLLERRVAGKMDAHELADLTDGDRVRKPDDEAVEDGFREELGDQAQPGETGEHEDRAGQQRQGDGERQVALVAAGGGQRRDDGGRDDGHRRGRSDDEMPRAAEEGVGDERQRRGVEPVLRRHAGDPGIGEPFGYQQRPDRQRGDDVPGEPGATIPRQPARRRQQALQPWRSLSRPGEQSRVADGTHAVLRTPCPSPA